MSVIEKPPALTWLEQCQRDPTLRALVEAEMGRLKVELDTAKYQAEHWRQVAGKLESRLEAGRKRKG